LRTDLAITDAAGRATIHSIQLNRDSGQFRIRITVVKEQARAGIISFQYISDTRPTPVAPAAPAPPAAPAEPSAERSAGPPAAEPPSAEPAATVARSPGITPTTAKMGSRIGKKWIVLAVVVVVAAGAAAFAVSRAGAKSSSTVSSSVVSISPPTITIGNPNP
jgi:hypothetical protein